MEQILKQIIAFVDQAHGDQTRKYTPDRYVVHPVRVMRICQKYTDDLPVLAAALLHDVLEDTPVSKQQIADFLDTVMSPTQREKAVSLVVELTDIYTKGNYPQWNRRKRKQMEVDRLAAVSADAQTIKYADVLDNSIEITRYDPDFGKRFLAEARDLLRHARQGNGDLRVKAMAVVDEGLSNLNKNGGQTARGMGPDAFDK